jgi:eukaryotic-like serine/threonine-protein kinase
VTMATRVGTLVGRYEIDSELGRGAMGVVYRARDPRIDRSVAIKTVTLSGLEPDAEQEYRERFVVEARAAGRLSHPRIVTIFDVAEDPDTLTPYIVMEYVSGRSLEEVLCTENGTLPLDTALQVTQELAEALDYAHAQGIVHRDVKPSNIIVAEDGHPKIADFGIAKLNVPDLPQTGRTLGTPAYMSPEQFRGDPVDGRSDLFSLGVILYQLLTRHRPFQGDSTRTISFKVLNRDPVPATALNAELCPELGHVIARAIAKDPSQRYQTGMEMALDLRDLRGSILPPSSNGESQMDHGRELPADWRRIISFTTTLGVAVKIGHSDGENDSQSNAVPFSQPWQQLSIAFLTFGFLALAFVGLWQTIPINAAHVTARAAVLPDLSKAMVNLSTGLANNVSEHAPTAKASSTKRLRRTSLSGRVPSNSPMVVQTLLEAATPPQVLQQSLPSTLRISVEHHFGTARLSVWIDEKLTYSYSLRGAVKKRMLLLKGVQGYFSDSVEVPGGEHLIRVRVLSADNSYDQSGSIRGTFAPGSQKLLTTQFDKNNRGMRLSLQ